ncbi:MAG: hypothetical protein WDZ30_10285 [Cellvibrionaceae bacterium]
MHEDGIHGGETGPRGNPKWNYFRRDVVDYQTELLYGSFGPWPTPAPGRPLSEYAEVCNLPKEELKDWKKNVSLKYLWIIASRFLPGLWWAYFRSGGRYADFADETFSAHLSHGMYSKFLCPLDKGDLALFKDKVPAVNDDPREYQKADFSCMEWICNKTYPDTYAAATIVLFKVDKPDDPIPRYRALAIHIYQVDEQYKKITSTADTLTPEDEQQNRWELAKYFALQGAVHRVNMTEHGKLHFPFDSINAITKSILPTQHLLFRLLIPHFRLSLAVDNSVLEGKYSLLSRTNWVIYSPFTAEGKYTRRLIPDAYVGRPGKPNAFPEYWFSPKPSYPKSSFGIYLQKNYAIFHKFITSVIEDTLPAQYDCDDNSGARRNWEFIALWAESIAEWVPGFPKREQLLPWEKGVKVVNPNRQLLIDTVTLCLWTLTVAHAADHAGFAQAGPTRNVFRIHLKPPLKNTTVENDFHKSLVKRWDLFQSYLTHQLFYKPHNVENLVAVIYDFRGHPNELKLNEYRDIFIRELRECDVEERRRDGSLPKLEDVSSSIQY